MSYVSAKGHFWGVTKSVKSRYIGSYTHTIVTIKHSMFSHAYRRGDVSGASPKPGRSSNQESRQRLSDERVDAHAPRPRGAEIRRDPTGLGTLVRGRLQSCAAGVPASPLAGTLCRVCAATPAAAGVQWVQRTTCWRRTGPSPRAGFSRSRLWICGYGYNDGLGRHGGRGRFQPLPPAGRVCVGLHVFPG